MRLCGALGHYSVVLNGFGWSEVRVLLLGIAGTMYWPLLTALFHYLSSLKCVSPNRENIRIPHTKNASVYLLSLISNTIFLNSY